MGIDLHLLTKGAASNEATDERRHTRPPVVPGKEGISTKETTVTGGWRGMYRRDEIVACVGRYIKTILKYSKELEKCQSEKEERGKRGEPTERF